MTDQPFIDAIIDNPLDDTPRLVYADFLEERGDTNKALFLRLQATIQFWNQHHNSKRSPVFHPVIGKITKTDFQQSFFDRDALVSQFEFHWTKDGFLPAIAPQFAMSKYRFNLRSRQRRKYAKT